MKTFSPRASFKTFLSLAFAITLISGTALAQDARFTSDVVNGCFPLTVKFTDQSVGTVSTYAWDFGNGNSSDLRNPSAVYTSPGVYTVSLTVTNGSQHDTETKTGYITVYDFPVVNFSFDKASGCAPLTVKFTDLSTPGSGAITEWNWIFDDGGTRIEQNPQYTFTTSGSKTIALQVKNQYGCKTTAAKTGVINVNGPVAAFTANVTSVCQVPATIQFTNTSTGSGALTYTWSFGDGSTGTNVNESHVYNKAGTYTVVLKARDPQGCETTASSIIHAGNEGGIDFQASALSVCEDQTVQFTEHEDAPVLSREWDFGNSTIVNSANPVVAFSSPGTYSVTLKVLLQGKTCESVATKNIEVVADPVPSFTYKADCNYNVTLTSTSQKSTRVEWYVEGALASVASSFSRNFTSSGSYAVKLIAYNKLGCGVESDQVITIPGKPFAAFSPYLEQDCLQPSLSGCAPFTLQLKNQSLSTQPYTLSWDFGDGQKATSENPTHVYNAIGTFTLTLTITTNTGCTGTTSAKVTVSNVTPVAKFDVDKVLVCEGEDVTFTDQSDNATFWCWDFGDGNTGQGKTAKHAYAQPGTYTVKLTAKNGGCSSVLEKTNLITVKDPLVDFLIVKNCDDPFTIDIQNLSANYTSIAWDFGDGTHSSTDVMSHHFASTGHYTVKLTGTNTTTGCTVIDSAALFIQDLEADFEIDLPKPCKGSPVTFTNKSSFAQNWVWAFDNGDQSNALNPTETFYAEGQFNVKLTVYDVDGCMETKTLPVQVIDIEGNFNFAATSTCDRFNVVFTDNSHGSPPITAWLWDFGDGATSTDQDPTHAYTVTGEYPVTLTLTNAEGVCSFIGSQQVVFTIPQPDFIPSRTGACIGEVIHLANTSANASLYSWDFDDGQSSAAVNPDVSFTATGLHRITLHATDYYGCEQTISKDAVTITKPVAGFNANGTSSECPPLTTIFRDTSAGSVTQWNWTFGDSKSSVLQNPAYVYVTPGTFDVTLIVTDTNGCTDTTAQAKLIHVGGPSGSFASDVTASSCVFADIPFSTSTINAVTHHWDFGDGTVTDEGPLTETHHTYTKVGSYTPSLILVDGNGCKVIADGDVQVVVNDTTAIEFDYSPKCLFEGEPFAAQATAANDEAMSWQWLIGDTPVSLEQQMTLSLDSAGEYVIRVKGINSFGCVSTLSGPVRINGSLLDIPNVFTPNGDATNQYFVIPDLSKSSWDLEVFNRWGRPVYAQKNYANDWDGGQLAAGVYYYNVINSFCRDRGYKGIVSILR